MNPHTIATETLSFLAKRLGYHLVPSEHLHRLHNLRSDLDGAIKERNGYRDYLKLCDDDLTKLGIPQACPTLMVNASGLREILPEGFPLDIRQRMDIAFKQPVERDWAWALAQVNAGQRVTHPRVQSSPEDTRGHVRKVGVFLVNGVETPVYEILEGNCLYEKLTTDSYTWKKFVHQAQKTHGWEIIPDEPAKRSEG